MKGYPKEEQMIDRLESTTQVGLAKYKEVDAAFSEGRLLAGYRKLSELKPILGDMQDLLDKVVEQLRQITSASLATEAETRERIQFLLLGGIVLNIMIAVGLAIYFNRGTARRLAILMDNTARLAKHQVLNPPVPGSDEIAHLDRVFHDMSTDLAQAERAKQEYVAMISHDLRSPLTSIQFILTMIAGGTYGNLSESGVSRAKAAESSAERLINLINTLLDLEKMEAGMLNMQLADVSLSTIVKRSVEAIDSLAEQAGINVEVQQADVNVKADADRLVQVLVNLVSNAIKFSPKGSSIAISIKNVPNFVEVRVTDQGRGIPADQLSSVFDRFQQ
ncbi:MAG: HAMP domain-containing histidine kinase, partial [Verrucomicrobia bacterium]|nr:HAMP domain-containing histidine kinase [Verrucomicrobiota bacterium]